MSLPTSFDELRLARGNHLDRTGGMCAMEAAAWFAGEPHDDHPDCVDAAIAFLMRRLNDACTDDERDAIVKPLIPLCLDTDHPDDVLRGKFWVKVRDHEDLCDKVGLTERARVLAGWVDASVAATASEAYDTASNTEIVKRAPALIREMCAEARECLDRESAITVPEDFTVLDGV